jgi:deoxyribonuclease V
MNLAKLEAEQAKLAKKIVANDGIHEIRTVAGCDIAYTGNKIVSAIIVMDYPSLKVREFRTSTGLVRFPYIPGFLSYREAPMIIETYHKLELDPDLLMVDGNGRLHPRRMGLASAVGLALDKPSIGVAKKLLMGQPQDGYIVVDGERLAGILETKEKAKPIYVSQGHKVSLRTAINVAKACQQQHKLPEPLHQAHKIANKERRKLKDTQ